MSASESGGAPVEYGALRTPATFEGLPAFSLRRQLHLLIGDKRRLVVALIATSIVSGFTEAAVLAIVAQVANALVTHARVIHTKLGPFDVHAHVGHLILLGFGLTMFRLVLQFPQSTLPVRIASSVQAKFRRNIFRAFTKASTGVQASEREGQLQEVMTSQTAQATAGALQATTLITAALTFVILMGSAIGLSVVAAAIVFTIAVLMFAVLRPLRALGHRRSRTLSAAQVAFAGGIAEANRLAEETQVFGVSGAQYDRLSGLIGRCEELFYKTNVIARLVPNLYQSLIFLVLIAGLAALWESGAGHTGALGAVILLLVRASQYGQTVQASYQGLQQSLPFIERLEYTERRYRESAEPDAGRPLPRIETLGFDRVSFAYVPGREVLSEVTFQVQAGEAIGIVGPSGAGKSTLVQILLRLRPPEHGHYVLNGEPVEDFARADWQRVVSYVPQEPRLLHATVTENIRFFRDIDDESIRRAARLARIHEDIESWTDGYETLVGPRANAVSGGQQQRLCLARALAARPQVLVLDEPTSALDPHSETLIQESLTALKNELTLFTIAHRMSTLDTCDRVMVIVDGCLVAFDTKAVLQEQNAYYRSASLIAAGTAGAAGL